MPQQYSSMRLEEAPHEEYQSVVRVIMSGYVHQIHHGEGVAYLLKILCGVEI